MKRKMKKPARGAGLLFLHRQGRDVMEHGQFHLTLSRAQLTRGVRDGYERSN